MSQEKMIEEIVRQILGSMAQVPTAETPKACAAPVCGGINPKTDYPLAGKRPELVTTPTGKTLNDITLEKVLSGEIKSEDVRITAQTLELQAQVAESVGRVQFARNLRRAAEQTKIPDDRLLEIYNALRPYRSTKAELLAIAAELENVYQAKVNAALVKEAADVYERRGRLRVE